MWLYGRLSLCWFWTALVRWGDWNWSCTSWLTGPLDRWSIDGSNAIIYHKFLYFLGATSVLSHIRWPLASSFIAHVVLSFTSCVTSSYAVNKWNEMKWNNIRHIKNLITLYRQHNADNTTQETYTIVNKVNSTTKCQHYSRLRWQTIYIFNSSTVFLFRALHLMQTLHTRLSDAQYQEIIFLFSYDFGRQWKIDGRTTFVNNNLGEGINIFASIYLICSENICFPNLIPVYDRHFHSPLHR